MKLRNAFRWLPHLTCAVCLAIGVADAGANKRDAKAEAELRALAARLPSFQVMALPTKPGEVVLRADQSLTIDSLRGVRLDRRPPRLGQPLTPYDPRMTDDYAFGQAPYVADGISPFRFRYFNCEFNYGGWHNFAMADYAATRGFNILYPYGRTIEQGAHLPRGTKWLSWNSFINWSKWFGEHGLPKGRYDLLVDQNLVAIHLREEKFQRPAKPAKLSECGDYLMIDMEHPVLPPGRLRQQSWYPGTAADAERAAFEKSYYDGYAQSYISAVEAARKQGWRNISIYGWAPYGRTWGGLEKPDADPGTDHAWNMFGRQIYESVDIINNSVYCFYWSPKNVAYTLANIDANLALVNSMPEPKPLRPYFMTLLHGGGGGWRWWRRQPLATEEQRAMIAMAFFAGIDGLDSWNWSGTGNHQVPAALTNLENSPNRYASGADVMIKDAFELLPENAPAGATPEQFHRYDVLHVLGVDKVKGSARFQKIRRGAPNHGVADDQPVYAMPIEQLKLHLRILSEPVAAMIEGMALVKPVEYILRHGTVKIDVPARRQFKETLPIVRRVKCGRIHVVITYDPRVVYGGQPREIVLEDFDGHRGLKLRLPADEQTRLFILRDETSARGNAGVRHGEDSSR